MVAWCAQPGRCCARCLSRLGVAGDGPRAAAQWFDEEIAAFVADRTGPVCALLTKLLANRAACGLKLAEATGIDASKTRLLAEAGRDCRIVLDCNSVRAATGDALLKKVTSRLATATERAALEAGEGCAALEAGIGAEVGGGGAGADEGVLH